MRPGNGNGKMDKASFSRLITDIYLFFDRQKLPSREQLGIWYEDLRWIPASACSDIMTHFRELDSLPRNIPKAIKSGFGRFRKTNPMVKNYDPYDDPSYPIENLYRALAILDRKGEAEFMAYCRSVKMPSQDIDRVMNKSRYQPEAKKFAVGMLKDVPQTTKNYQGPR